MTIKNLTPHAVNVLQDNGTYKAFESVGIARAEQTYEEVCVADGITFVKSSYGAPINLPDPEEGILLIVSKQTIEAAQGVGRTTNDLVVPVDIIRNEKGQILGCRKLSFI